MTSEQTAERLRGPVEAIAREHGLILEEIDVRPREGATAITVVVDLPEDRVGSADLEDVAAASRALSELLDADESLVGPGASLLEVTTPGAERTLSLPRHFRRARRRMIRLRTQDGQDLRGRLLDVSADDVLQLRLDAGVDDRGRPRKLPAGLSAEHALPIAEVASARVEIEFSPPPELADLTDDQTQGAGDADGVLPTTDDEER